jgi:PiT family inorganic phosphate transporter
MATSIATGALKPKTAVILAGVLNLVGAFLSVEVAVTVTTSVLKIQDGDTGQLIPSIDASTGLTIIFAGLIGGILWNLLTWLFGIPSSSSHALFGGYGGAAVAKAGFGAIIAAGWTKTLIFIVVAPMIGLTVGLGLMTAIFWLFRHTTPMRVDRWFRRLQLTSAAAFSLMHGANDAQKTMGIITGALVAGGYLATFEVPFWVVLSAHAAIALGTLLGGWRVIRTMGHRITRLKPVGGFCAETGGAFTVLFAAAQGIPASTTHTIAGEIVGVGTAQRLKAVRWGKASEILWAWVITIPTTLAVGGLSYLLVRTIFPEAQ